MHSPSIRKPRPFPHLLFPLFPYSNFPFLNPPPPKKTDVIQLYIPGMFVESARMPRPGLQVDRRECTGTLAALHPWGSF